MKNKGNMTLPKDHDHLPVTEGKDTEICGLPNKEFKIAILGKPNELQENRQFSKIQKTIHDHNEK